MKPLLNTLFFSTASALLPFVALATSSLTTPAEPSFESAFADDHLWPSHIELTEDVFSEEGERLLRADLPVVFIRAYKDEMLAVVDREGTFIVDAHKTNFLKEVAAYQAESEKSGHFSNFLNQIGRRVFNLSYDKEKAVSEAKLAHFDAFLICRTKSDKDTLRALRTDLEKLQPQLEVSKIEPILVFEETMGNLEFYELVKTIDPPYTAVVPIFQRGFLDAVFTGREADSDFLLIARSGKVLHASSRLTEAFARLPNTDTN
jgi:hypothetical protein